MSDPIAPLPVPVSVVCPRCGGDGKHYHDDATIALCKTANMDNLCGGPMALAGGCGGSGLVPALLPAREVEKIEAAALRREANAFEKYWRDIYGANVNSPAIRWWRSRLAALGCPEET